MHENKKEKLPLDTRLVSEAVIELNISKRSVKIYPPEHPIVKESISRAFIYLQKLLEIRSAITLGIAGDTFVVDEYKLDSKNPVFREFAGSLHSKGIAAITFLSGLNKNELSGFHELITARDMPIGKDLADLARTRDIIHITLSPVDFSRFRFVEGSQKNAGTSNNIWEDYIYGLLEGKLSEAAESRSAFLEIAPEEVASAVNAAMADHTDDESYDRVITAYLQHKEGAQLSSETYSRFITFVDNLNPELKGKFLARSFAHVPENIAEVEKMISDMRAVDFERITKVFSEHSSNIPVAMKNFIEKLASIKQQSGAGDFDFVSREKAVVDDVELDEDIIKIFTEDTFKLFVGEDYQKALNEMLLQTPDLSAVKLENLEEECRGEVLDRVLLGVMIEIFESDDLSEDEYLAMHEKFTENVNSYIEAGRFDEIVAIHNTLSSHVLDRLSDAADRIEKIFYSEEFTAKFIDAVRLWGRQDRESVFRLVKALRRPIIAPVLEALLSEPDASMRKFFLSILQSIGKDVTPFVITKLNDRRWYVIRNMLYLLRECEGSEYISYVRKFMKSENIHIRIEAEKTLLHFNTPDAIPFLKQYLQNENTDLKRGAVRLSGLYRVKEALPYLIEIIEKQDFFGKETAIKSDAIRALGEIGDKAAVKTLKKVYSSRGLFSKGHVEQLKVELFRTLENYPPDSIQEILTLGLRSGNEEIRLLSERHLARTSALTQDERGDDV